MRNLFSSTHHLLEMARTDFRLPARIKPGIYKIYPLLALILAVLFIFISQLLGGIPLALIFIAQSVVEGTTPNFNEFINPQNPLLAMGFLIFGFGPLFFVLWGWLLLVERRQLWTTGFELGGIIWKYLRGLLVGFGMFAGAVGLLALFGFLRFAPPAEAGPTGLMTIAGVLIIFLGWLVQGAAEELLTRGWLLPVIGARWGMAAGVVLSSLLFAVLHLLNPNVSELAMLNLFLFGLFAALYTLYERGLWGVCAIHSVWNWTQGNIFGFEVSGQRLGNSSLLYLQESGPDMLTGGSFGPEGGLAVTLILVVSCGLVLLASSRQQKTT